MRKPRHKLQKVMRAGFWNTEAGKHSLRVGSMLKIFAEDLGMSPDLLEKVGDFHDIGKSQVPYQILYKKGRFEPWERAIVNSHAMQGFKLLGCAEKEVAQGALRHHAADTNDPLYIQILRLVDVAEALTARRCYKAAMPKEKVRKILEEEHCVHLSAEANRIFWARFDELL